MEEVTEQAPRSAWIEGRQAMRTPEGLQAVLKLSSLGWGAKRISRELGYSRSTERSYLRQGGWQPYAQPQRPGRLRPYRDWLDERFRQHRGNCDVVRQELQREHRVAVHPERSAWRSTAAATASGQRPSTSRHRWQRPALAAITGTQPLFDSGTVRVLENPLPANHFCASYKFACGSVAVEATRSPAYFLLKGRISDAPGYFAYLRALVDSGLLHKHGFRREVVIPRREVHLATVGPSFEKGEFFEILRFPFAASAQAFRDAPQYREIVKLRERKMVANAVLFE